MTRKSTVLRDLAQILKQYSGYLEEAGFTDWVKHFREDIGDLETGAELMQHYEPPLPSISSLAGSIPDFTGGLSPEEYLRRMRAGTLCDND